MTEQQVLLGLMFGIGFCLGFMFGALPDVNTEDIDK